jgi:small-conductance mechanosensitive channel
MEVEMEQASNDTNDGISLWAGLFTAPAVSLLNLVVAYTLVQLACRDADETGVHLALGIALLITAAGTIAAWWSWRRHGGGWPGEEAGAIARRRFMAMCGMLMSVLFLLMIVAQWISIFILSPCQH